MDNAKDCLKLNHWSEIETLASHEPIERNILPKYLNGRRWFAAKSREISSVTIVCQLRIPGELIPSYLWLLKVDYSDNTMERYVLPIAFIPEQKMPEEQMRPPVLCHVQIGLEPGCLCDASWSAEFRTSLMRHFTMQSNIDDTYSRLDFNVGPGFHSLTREMNGSRVLNAEQSNTSIIFSNKLFFKLYRKVETGTNCDIELSKFLTTEAQFKDTPAWMGDIQWHTSEGTFGIGILQQFMPGSNVAWNYFADLIKSDDRDNLIHKVEQLGTLTAGMHQALGGLATDWFDEQDQESLRARVMSELTTSFEMLRDNMDKLPESAKSMGQQLLNAEHDIEHLVRDTYHMSSDAMKIRLHGDLHLGQVLVSNDRFFVTDFEGEPGRSFDERRLKQSPVKDLAGMIRSFHYAVFSAKPFNENDHIQLENLLHQMTDAYLRSYGSEVPEGLLKLFIIEKALYELRYELNNRPDWAIIPIAGLKMTVDEWMHHA